MKLIIVALFALLFCSSCSSEVGQNGGNTMNLVDLNDDILYFMFERMPIDSLVKMAQMNSRFEYIANDVARRKYRHYHLKIIADTGKPFVENENQLTIYDIPMALNVLEYFGNSFRTLKITDTGTESSDLANLIRFANKYCSKTLKALSLDIQPHSEFNDFEYDEQLTENYEIAVHGHQNFLPNVLVHFMMPFEVLEELDIQQRSFEFNETMKLNQLFPQLKRFHFNVMMGADYGFLNCEFPYLEDLRISVAMEYNDNIKENVKKIIQKNPTIRSINLFFYATQDPNWLKFVGQHLPQLENLSLSTFENDENDALQINNVKHLEFAMANIGAIDKILMPRLESLTIDYEPENFNKWMEFLRNHRHLRCLHLDEIVYNGRGLPVNEITAILPNLTDVTFMIVTRLEIQCINRLIDNHKKLNRFRLIFKNSYTIDYGKTLHKQFENEWSIEDTLKHSLKVLSFKRKHPILE